MRRKPLLVPTLLLIACGACLPDEPPPPEPPGPEGILDLVDPLIGTGGRGWWAGNAFVGATTPFGMVQVGPDTSGPNGASWFNHCSGYHAADEVIDAFSHTHLHGTGIPDLGAVGFMPVAGSMDAARLAAGYASGLDRSTEVARPGYYAVTLSDPGIRVELTATEHTARHRYIASGAESASTNRMSVLVDVAHTLPWGEVLDGGIEILPDERMVQGWAHNENAFSRVFGGMPMYFAARFEAAPLAWGTWSGETLAPGAPSQDGAQVGAWLEFDTSGGQTVELAVGVSYVDIEQARLNLDAEGGVAQDFAAARQQAEELWLETLSVLTFEGGTAVQRRIMATALYHVFQMPNSFTDVGGSYMGFDGAVHQADGFVYTTNLSLWDTYRTLHPLLVLLAPDRQRDAVLSLVRMYEQGGYLPKWPLGSGYTNIMVGSPADLVIADTYLKGITDIEVETAYEAALLTATGPTSTDHVFEGRVGVQDYLDLGYVAADHQTESVSRTMEFALADFAIGNLAAALARTDDAELFAQRSMSYRNLWDEDSGYFRPREADGSWVEPFDPLEIQLIFAPHFTEGNALQYLWMAHHDVQGLTDLLGGPDVMQQRLESFFDEAVQEQAALPDEGEVEDTWWLANPPRQYWHGNEPDLHAAYLFAQIGRPDLTQRWVRWIGDALYHAGTSGIPGNDDAGTLAAWYVFSALGFYPVAGSDLYFVGSPLFDRATLQLAGGELVVEAPGVSEQNIYVQSVTLNEENLDVPRLRHSDIASGGTLRFEMGPEPSDWGASTR